MGQADASIRGASSIVPARDSPYAPFPSSCGNGAGRISCPGAGRRSGSDLRPRSSSSARVLPARHAEVEGLVEGVQLLGGGSPQFFAASRREGLVERRVVAQDEVLEALRERLELAADRRAWARWTRTCSGCRTVRRTTRSRISGIGPPGSRWTGSNGRSARTVAEYSAGPSRAPHRWYRSPSPMVPSGARPRPARSSAVSLTRLAEARGSVPLLDSGPEHATTGRPRAVLRTDLRAAERSPLPGPPPAGPVAAANRAGDGDRAPVGRRPDPRARTASGSISTRTTWRSSATSPTASRPSSPRVPSPSRGAIATRSLTGRGSTSSPTRPSVAARSALTRGSPTRSGTAPAPAGRPGSRAARRPDADGGSRTRDAHDGLRDAGRRCPDGPPARDPADGTQREIDVDGSMLTIGRGSTTGW